MQSGLKIGDLAAEAGLNRIHMLAWRDLADVEAGGSEIHASMVASHWAHAGIDVTMRTSYAQGAPPETMRDGYKVVRRAGRYLIFPRAVAAELAGRHGPRDGLVEIWNGVPFFSPIWASGPRVTWLHHVHEDMWPLVLPPGLARMGRILERRLAPPFYRGTQVITLSHSSREHLLDRLRLPAANIHVVPPGVDARYRPGLSKTPEPTVLAVGRLMPSKSFDALIRAVHELRDDVPARLIIVGEGYARDELERLIASFGAEEWCELAGRVDDDELVRRYQESWVVASSSRSEGWGMTLTEAAACATPAVATRIPGHIDAVRDGIGGLLVDSDDEFVGALRAVLTDESIRSRLSEGALRTAQELTWDRTAYETLSVLAATARRR
ncbi:MAG: glycosyltransferase family 4 protein [Acidimicrobiales bacterium]|nr:glycosyltransferase family 4 protein [Acidimicrobiales bacterium]